MHIIEDRRRAKPRWQRIHLTVVSRSQTVWLRETSVLRKGKERNAKCNVASLPSCQPTLIALKSEVGRQTTIYAIPCGQTTNDTANGNFHCTARNLPVFVRACEPAQDSSEDLACFLVSEESKVHQDGAAPWQTHD